MPRSMQMKLWHWGPLQRTASRPAPSPLVLAWDLPARLSACTAALHPTAVPSHPLQVLLTKVDCQFPVACMW